MIIGALGGALGGVGFSLVFNQSQGLQVRGLAGITLAAVLIGAVWGLVTPPSWLRRVLTVLTLLWPLIGLLALATPATAQPSCGATMAVNQEPVPITGTSESAPLLLDLDQGDVIHLTRPATGDRGFFSITVVESFPVPVPADAGPVYHGVAEAGALDIAITVDGTSFGDVNVAKGDTSIAQLPFGLVHLQGALTSDAGETVCVEDVWVRFVSSPFVNPTGWASIGLFVLGISMMLAALAGAPASQPVSPPASAVMAQPATVPQDPEFPSTGALSCELFEADGRPVPNNEPLLAGREYRLDFKLQLDSDDEETEEAVVVASSSDAVVRDRRPQVRLGLGVPGLLGFSVPILTHKTGTAKVDVDVLRRGGLFHTERLRLSVVAEAASPSQAPVHTGHTTFLNPAAADGAAERRAALVVLYRDPRDASVDMRILDADGQELLEVDTPLQRDTLEAATDAVRSALTETLTGEGGFGIGIDAPVEILDNWLPRLAVAGRALFLALFPTPADARDVLGQLGPDAVVQVNQNDAGLAHATIPWNLVYGRQVEDASGSRVCRSYAHHDDGDCPEASQNPTVVCPRSFWGFRFVVEQPPTWVHRRILPPPLRRIAGEGPTVVNFNVEPGFRRWQEHLAALEALPDVEVLTARGRDELRTIWTEQADRLDVVYFYSHHNQGGRPVLTFGDAKIHAVNLDSWDPHWSRQPLFLLLGCGSGSNTVTTYAPLIDQFRLRGASGVIGTECTLTESVAEPFATALMERVLGGDDVGPAILDVRRATIEEHANPCGLAFSLYGLSELSIVREVAEASL